MKILEKLNRLSLIKKYLKHRDAKYIVRLLVQSQYCYRVALTHHEYASLLMNSSFEKPYPNDYEFPMVKETVSQIFKNSTYLSATHASRGVSGTTVKKYLQKYKKRLDIGDAFITDKKSFMRKTGKYYIVDAMHRLVAYGVHKEMKIKDFETEVIYCASTKRQI